MGMRELDHIISFTPLQLVGMVLSICAAIITLSSAITVIVSWREKIKSPENLQNEKIRALEERIENIASHLEKDNKRLSKLETGTRVTQKAILALLSHGIDGNDIDGMKKAKKDMEDYLIGGD